LAQRVFVLFGATCCCFVWRSVLLLFCLAQHVVVSPLDKIRSNTVFLRNLFSVLQRKSS
jgi:hypothetical protein